MDFTASQISGSSQILAFSVQTFIAGGALGLAFGVLPLVIGIKRERTKLGAFALVLCVISGLVLGTIVALPVAVAFAAVIATSEGPAVSRILNESAKGNTDLLHQIIDSTRYRPDERVQEETPFYPMVEEPTEPTSDERPEPRRPLVENLFS